MKFKFASACLAAGALLLPAAGFCADNESNKSSSGQYVSEALVTAKVKAEMARQNPTTLVYFSVRTDKSGVVVLESVARTQADKDKAESVARGVEGVKTVHNNIRLKSE
jgi:hyperosmotically inducible periplasmic protein